MKQGHFSPGSAQPQHIREARRLRQIERRWRFNRFTLTSTRWWLSWNRAGSSFLTAGTLALALFPLDMAFWKVESLPVIPDLGSLSAEAFRIWTVVLFLGNALIIEGLLTWHTPDHLTIKRRIRWLRFFSGGVPLLGFYIINLWRWVVEQRPEWVFDLKDDRDNRWNVPPAGAIQQAMARMLSKGTSASTFSVLWLHGGNFLLLFAWTSRLSEAGTAYGAHSNALTVQWTLHILLFCCTFDVLYSYLRESLVLGWRRILLWIIPPMALLPPFPFAFASVGTALYLETENTRKKTLCRMAFYSDGLQRLTAWAHLQKALDKSSGIFRHRLRTAGPGRCEEPGLLGRQLTTLFRLKVFLLGIDALALGFWVAQDPSSALILAVLLGAAALWLLAIARVLLRSQRPHHHGWLEAHDYGGLLGLGLLFALAFLQAGVWLCYGHVREAGLLVMSLIALGIMFAGMTTVLQPLLTKSDKHLDDRHDDFVWMLFFFGLALFSGLLAIDEARTEIYVNLIRVVALLTPLWHLGLAALSYRILLRPYRLQNLFNTRYPRWRLVFLLATLALPLGGFAVPYWIFSRHRHWPSRDPLREGTGS